MTRPRPYEPVDLKTVLADHEATRPRSQQTAVARADGRWGVGPSDVSDCRKAIEYRERPPAGYEPLPEDKTAAIVGSILHEGVATALRRRRRGRRHRLIEAEVFVAGFDVPGHLDLYERPLGRITDWKFVGEYVWDHEIVDGPRTDDLDQMMVYGLGLEDAGEPVREVRVVYVRRARPRDIEEFTAPYDRERALKAVDYLHSIIDALDQGAELPRDRLGPDFDGICRVCPARADCWQLDRAAEAGRTPAGWLFARDDEGIEAAAAAYDEAAKLAKPYVEQKDYARNLLDGVDAGIYGEWEVSWSRNRPKPPVLDVDTRLAIVEEHLDRVAAGLEAPMRPTDLPHPTKAAPTRKSSISVKRTRAAARVVPSGDTTDGPVELSTVVDNSGDNS